MAGQPKPIVVPRDPLNAVFTGQVRVRWASAKDPTNALRRRLDVLGACGPTPTDKPQADRLRWLRAKKAAWETYLESAYACGMFGVERGADLRARLTGIGDDGFRSAMAECMACWFLAGRMGFSVHGEAHGRNAKRLDMRVLLPEGDVGVEVKAPLRERPAGTTVWLGDDADKITQSLEAANKQFSGQQMNILIIAPNLRTHVCGHRRLLVKAAYGESVIVFDVNPNAGRLENERVEFSPQGKFLKTTSPGGELLKQDGLPGYRRISAVLCIEEAVREQYPCPADALCKLSEAKRDRGELARVYARTRRLWLSPQNSMWIDHNVVVLHNPYAYHSIPEALFQDYPQLVSRADHMVWTDGYAGFV